LDKVIHRSLADEVIAAERRLTGRLRQTPLARTVVDGVDDRLDVLFKLENQQTSGSFKYRGALNKVLAAKERGTNCLWTASTGNHGIALAEACRDEAMRCSVLLPEGTPESYYNAFGGLSGAEVEIVSGDILAAEYEARERADQTANAEFASPYNDVEVIAGHSTLGVEIAQELESRTQLDVFCATGGGGLAAGLKLGLTRVAAECRVHAVYPSASPALARGVARGHVIEETIGATLCHAVAGNLERDTVTVGLCRRLVDSFIAVDEDEIRLAWEQVEADGLRIDSSAAAAVAGMKKANPSFESGLTLVVIICAEERRA
jgi:threonine dehydratase